MTGTPRHISPASPHISQVSPNISPWRAHLPLVLRGRYAYCCLGVPNAADLDGENGAYESLLYKHATAVLNSLRRGEQAQKRWVALLEAQLSDEADEPIDPARVANRLRVAESKINNLETLLQQGLAERSDAAAALNMHVFNAYQSVPLQEQLGV